ncbi:MAG: hypothetical protein M0036_06850 [Desulfobacteraceae bacterium]|nr:hypothetical protein [Desulfobacteraceae bacterium]
MPCCDEHDKDAVLYDCLKHQTKVCAACAECKDPELYCKFRPSCMIHFTAKERAREKKGQGPAQ